MKSIKGTKTEKNLLIAFAGESQARNRYDMFAKQAKKEGYIGISKMFSEIADQERVHAKTIFKFLEGGEVEITASYPAGKIGTTEENLKSAAAGENYEHSIMYPDFAKIAEEEGFPIIAARLRAIAKAEMYHETQFLSAIEKIEKDKVFKSDKKVKWICVKCGYVHEGEFPPETCPACAHPKSYFVKKSN